MKKLLLLPFLFFALFTSCNKDEEDTFIPPTETPAEEETPNEEETPTACFITHKDGLLIIEGESFNLKGQWKVASDEKASGGKYIQYIGANSYNTQNLNNEISVKFKVSAQGNYLVRWYMRQPEEEATGDLANDVWIYFPGNLGRAYIDGSPYVLEHYEKFVSRSGKDGEFAYGGALDLHEPKKSSSWMRVEFPEAGEYTLKICARSSLFQLDKIVLSSGISDTDAQENSRNLTESTTCD